MHQFYEESDLLNVPIECFTFYAVKEEFPVRLHWHYYMEMIYVLKGSAMMNSDNHMLSVHEGDFILFHPQTVHGIFSDYPDRLEYAVLKFDIGKFGENSSYVPNLRSIFKYAQEKGMPSYLNAADAKKLDCKNIFRECIDEMQQHEYGYDMIVRSQISRLLMYLLRYYRNLGFPVEQCSGLAQTDYSIESITEYIDFHIEDHLKVSDLAKQCGMSYSHFAKRFQDIYRRSCKSYIENIRLHKAKDFLMFTDYDLNYISQECGFSDCSHLIRAFKDNYKMTPKQYRIVNHKQIADIK